MNSGKQVVELEDEAQGPVPELAKAPLVEAEDLVAGHSDGAVLSGRSRVPRTWRSVDFPTPEAPVMASISPSGTSRSRPISTET